MNLETKKRLISRTLSVGNSRIVLNRSRLAEIKEAITKQDIRDLLESKAISVKEVKGRKTIKKRKTRRKAGSIKKKVNTRKQDYVKLTRKLRRFLSSLKGSGRISQEDFIALRKQIRAKEFRSLSHLKERMKEKAEEATK